MNNGVKWRRFIVPTKVEQINDQFFTHAYKSNNIKIGVNDMVIKIITFCEKLFNAIGIFNKNSDENGRVHA